MLGAGRLLRHPDLRSAGRQPDAVRRERRPRRRRHPRQHSQGDPRPRLLRHPPHRRLRPLRQADHRRRRHAPRCCWPGRPAATPPATPRSTSAHDAGEFFAPHAAVDGRRPPRRGRQRHHAPVPRHRAGEHPDLHHGLPLAARCPSRRRRASSTSSSARSPPPSCCSASPTSTARPARPT